MKFNTGWILFWVWLAVGTGGAVMLYKYISGDLL